MEKTEQLMLSGFSLVIMSVFSFLAMLKKETTWVLVSLKNKLSILILLFIICLSYILAKINKYSYLLIPKSIILKISIKWKTKENLFNYIFINIIWLHMQSLIAFEIITKNYKTKERKMSLYLKIKSKYYHVENQTLLNKNNYINIKEIVKKG